MTCPSCDRPDDPSNAPLPAEYLDVLSSTRRRILLDVLEDRPAPASLEEVARAIAQREGADDMDRIAVDLHHCHLPKLSDAGVVDYDWETNIVLSIEGLPRE